MWRASARLSLRLRDSERLQYLDGAGAAGRLLLYLPIWQKPAAGLTETRIVVGLVIAIGRNNRSGRIDLSAFFPFEYLFWRSKWERSVCWQAFCILRNGLLEEFLGTWPPFCRL